MAFERIKIVKGHQYRYLVENVKENGKVKQKIIKYLGKVKEDLPVKEIKPANFDGIALVQKNGMASISRKYAGYVIEYKVRKTNSSI